MSEYRLKTPKEAKAVAGAYQKIEETVVGTYQKIEDAVVGGYKKIEDRFTETFLEKMEGDEPSEEPVSAQGE